MSRDVDIHLGLHNQFNGLVDWSHISSARLPSTLPNEMSVIEWYGVISIVQLQFIKPWNSAGNKHDEGNVASSRPILTNIEIMKYW